MVLSVSLPTEPQAAIGEGLKSYLRDVVAVDWPAMAKGTPLDDVSSTDRRSTSWLRSISCRRQHASLSTSATYAPLLNQILEVRHARLARIAASNSGITWAQWIAMWLISTATLLAIVLCNSHAFRMQIVAAHIYVVVVSAAYFVILAHDRPFIGQISVHPIAMQTLLAR